MACNKTKILPHAIFSHSDVKKAGTIEENVGKLAQ